MTEEVAVFAVDIAREFAVLFTDVVRHAAGAAEFVGHQF
jgi:hypothetical protein